jgi:hypothetical protein
MNVHGGFFHINETNNDPQQHSEMAMKFSRWVYRIAGIYGILATFPLYFYEHQLGVDYPPPVSHPEYYYGFAGVTLVWQLLFLAMARDPVKYRSIMPFTVLEKATILPLFLILYPGGRFPALWLVPATIDIILGLLFLTAYIRTVQTSATKPG